MDNIPEQFKALADSNEIYDQAIAVGNKFNLHIDQIGALGAEIRDILRGVAKPGDFTKDITESMEIDPALAKQITEAVNTDILQEIRKKMQAISASQDIASIEQAGGFSVEPTHMANPEHVDTDVSHGDKQNLIESIENPLASPKIVMPKQSPGEWDETHTEPLIDMLLTGGTDTTPTTPAKRINLMDEEPPTNLPGAEQINDTTPLPQSHRGKMDSTPDVTPPSVATPTPSPTPTPAPVPKPTQPSQPPSKDLYRESTQ